jgi:hypothetical protein
VVSDLEAEPLGHGRLPLLDATIDELLDPTAVEADDVVVVRALVQLEDGHAVLEVMARDEAGGLELRQHPVDRREADVLARVDEALVDVLGGHVARAAALEDVEDLETRQRDLEPCLAQVLAFHVEVHPME